MCITSDQPVQGLVQEKNYVHHFCLACTRLSPGQSLCASLLISLRKAYSRKKFVCITSDQPAHTSDQPAQGLVQDKVCVHHFCLACAKLSPGQSLCASRLISLRKV